MARSILVSAFMGLFVSVVQIYTWVTLPIYFLSQKPWQKRAKSAKNRVKLQVPPLIVPQGNMFANDEEEEDKQMSAIYVRDFECKKKHPILTDNDSVTDMLDKLVEVHGANNLALGKKEKEKAR